MIYARIISDKGKSKVYRAGDDFIKIELTYKGQYATIAWCKESMTLGVYGNNEEPIKIFSSNELGHFDK